MKYMRWLSAVCLMALLICPGESLASEWDYPLSPLIVCNREGFLDLANKEHLLSSDYEPSDLVTLKVRKVESGIKLRKAAAAALEAMFEAAERDGCVLYVKSGYRSYQTQKTMYSNRVKSMGRDDGLVQSPGASDHQTGLGVDVLNYEWTKKDGMNYRFASEREAQWMAEHCWEYGFIIRYMSDKEEITGIKYEPWHLRYVGPEAAAYIRERHYALEEFYQELQETIDAYEAGGAKFSELVRRMNQPPQRIVLETTQDGEEEYSVFYE